VNRVTFRVLKPVAVLTEVCDERSTLIDIQELHPAANRKDREPSFERGVEHSPFRLVAAGKRLTHLFRVPRAVPVRLDIGTADEHQSVDLVECLAIQGLRCSSEPYRLDRLAVAGLLGTRQKSTKV
jgi:hypothetical protein